MLTTNDPAGMGINFTNAINRYTEHQCRLVTTEQRYNIDFGKDLYIPDLNGEQLDELRDLLASADIFHFHMISDENMNVGSLLVKDFIHGKRIIHHHHGHPVFRSNPGRFFEKYQKLNRTAIVSTPDLLYLLPGSQWLPNLVPINDSYYLPDKFKNNDTVVVGQSPTRRELKNCIELEWAIENARNKCPKRIIHRNIEKLQHKKCLIEKRKCDIIFDHMQGYFGVSSLESLSQGKAVIAGLDIWNIECVKKFTGIEKLPWCLARNKNQLLNVLIPLINDSEKRQEIGNYSRSFMENHWTEQQVLQILFDVYCD